MTTARLPLSNQNIIDCLHQHYGMEIVALTTLPLGADMNSVVFKAEAKDKSNFFVKLKRGQNHDICIEIMDFLRNAGIKQIIPIIKTTSGKASQHIDDFTLIVYPFIEGQNGFICKLTTEQWVVFGKALKQVHEIQVTTSIQRRMRRETYSSKWRDSVREIYAKIEAKPISDEISTKLLEFINKHIQTIRHLVNRADQLAETLQKESTQFVLCHSDIHGGNTLLDKDNNLYIIDWDDPILAPKERDLMFIGGGVGNVWNNPDEEKLFYSGYGKSEIDMRILNYYRHERIVEDIAIYFQDILLNKVPDVDRAENLKHFIAMFEKNGVIEIALKTDEKIRDLGECKVSNKRNSAS